jgi:hypothetical protein
MIRTFVVALAAVCFCAGVVRADQTTWLSSLDITKASQGWGKPQVDKAVGGAPMTLAGQAFAHGFGTHAPSLLFVKLDGSVSRFQATAGLDDEVGAGRGTAEFLILGDGNKVLWRSGIKHSGQAPSPVDINLTGMRQMILRVTTAGGIYDFDHADWADAKFTYSGAAPETVAIPVSAAPEVIYESAGPEALKIQPPYSFGVHVDTPVIWTPAVLGARPLKFKAPGIPKGLAIDASTGTITGKLTAAGDYPVHLTATNGSGSVSQTLHIVAGDTLAITPPMGWNSYDAFGDNVVESEVVANAKYVHDKMLPYGWDTVVVDYRWYDPGAHDNNANGRAGAALTLDAYGRLLPSPNRFPSGANGIGFKALADQIHAMGLKFGIHIMRGIPRNAVTQNLPIDGSQFHAADAANTADTCGWCQDMYGVHGATPAGQAYYDSIFRLYASWGVDYIKMDDTSAPYHTDEIEAVHNAIEKCGRSIIYSLSPGETPIEDAKHVETHANMWRVSGDYWDSWSALRHSFDLDTTWHDFRGPGHWPDSDMLPVGHLSIKNRSVDADRQTRFTKPEQVTMLSLWCLQPAPLMVGANLPDNDQWTLSLLTNPEVLAVDQDPSTISGAVVKHDDNGTEVWARTLADGSLAVGLFNQDEFDEQATANWADLKISGPQTVRDLWQRKTLGVFNDKYTVTIPSHGAVMLRLTPVK